MAYFLKGREALNLSVKDRVVGVAHIIKRIIFFFTKLILEREREKDKEEH